MSARRRWLVLNYGPGVGIALVGLAGFIATGRVWALAFGALGFAMTMQATSSIHLYRSAYFRGRGDQLHDMADGHWPNPADMHPQPWDPIGR